MGLGLYQKIVCIMVLVLFIIPIVSSLESDSNHILNANTKNNVPETNPSNQIKNLNFNQYDTFEKSPKQEHNGYLSRNLNGGSPYSKSTFTHVFDEKVLDNNVKEININSISNKIKDLSPTTLISGYNQYNSDVIYLENPPSFFSNTREQVYDTITGGIITTSEQQLSESSYNNNINTRASRATEDLELWNIRWEEKNSGWCEQTDLEAGDDGTNLEHPNWYQGNQASIGSFKVGEKTIITVTVMNNGDETVYDVPVNLTITDFIHSNQPMKQNPSTGIIDSISPGQTKEVTFEWTPPYGTTSARIYAEVDWHNDFDNYNDAFSWRGIRVCKWWDDLESSTSGWSHYARTDITSTSVDDWSVTSSAFAQSDATHTGTTSWYEGYLDGLLALYPTDSYRNNNSLSLESPSIDLGSNVDERFWLEELGIFSTGPYTGYTAYLYHVTCVNWLITGETEENSVAGDFEEYANTSDILYVGDVSDDDGSTWGQHFNAYFSGRLGNVGETEWYYYNYYHVNDQTQEIYYYPGIPFNWDVSNWNNVKFRHTFDSDDDGIQEIGFYLDDFVIYGNDNFTIPYRLGLIEVTYPKTDGVPILYENSEAKFTTKVKNFGEQNQFNVDLSIKELDLAKNELGAEVYSNVESSVSLGRDEEKEITWRWTPENKGDYILMITVGDLEQEWTPLNNKFQLILHVGPSKEMTYIEILVVDDDNSEGSRSIGNPYWYVNTENKMLLALNDNEIDYRVFTVSFNQSGPTAEIMEEYDCVIWMTGLENEFDIFSGINGYNRNNQDWDITLKSEDEWQLENYLDNNGKLWLISPSYFHDHYSSDYGNIKTTAGTNFASKYLHIDRAYPNTTVKNEEGDIITRGTPDPLEGVEDTIMDGVRYDTYEEEPPKKFDDKGGWVSKYSIEKETYYLFYQDQAHYYSNALLYEGQDFMTSYFSFNFYLISNRTDRADCVFLILTSFGMTGGGVVTPYNFQEQEKSVIPGKEIHFRFNIENIGKHVDTFTLSAIVPSEYNKWSTRWQVNGENATDVTIQGLKKNNNVYLYVQAPSMDDPEDPQIRAGTKVTFTVKAKSDNTKLENFTSVTAVVLPIGNITINCAEPEREIDVTETANFKLRILNTTNGDDNVNVKLSVHGNGRTFAKFLINGKTSTTPEVEITLEPNEENNDVELQFTPGAHTHAGNYNLAVYVKNNEIVEDISNLIVTVKQFYQVRCHNELANDDRIVNTIIDPNNYAYLAEEYIKSSFSVKVQNYGNGEDNIKLEYEENENSRDTSNWLFHIVLPATGENLSFVEVPYYDETKNPQYGEEEIGFDVYIPMDAEVGSYVIDFKIKSSGTEVLNPLEDEEQNNIISFKFDIIKPNLQFTKFNPEYGDNFQFRDYLNNMRITRDFENNNEFYIKVGPNEISQLQIEFEITIYNIGSSEIDLEPSNVHLNISHSDESGFYVYDTITNLTPYAPANSRLIEPGQNGTFKFLWDFIDQPHGTEIEYTFKITVDPQNVIIEENEEDNSDQVRIIINHQEKLTTPPPEDNFTIGVIVVIIIIIVIILSWYFVSRRNQKKDELD